MTTKLENLYKRRKQATEDLMELIEKTYPVGIVLPVLLGGHAITVEVTGHSQHWWVDADEIYGNNIVTGKRRVFRPSDIIHS